MNTTTTTTTPSATINNTPAVSEALIRNAQDKLTKSLGKDSLDDLVASRTRRSLLLCDISSSMSFTIRTGERRIDALRKVVENLRESQPVPVAAFNGDVRLVDDIPNPHGGTRMGSAIDYGKGQGANHLILVTDGESQDDAISSARAFGGPIDTFYIGDGNDRGARVCKEIADITGGTAHLTDLGKPKELASKLRGLIGDGSTF